MLIKDLPEDIKQLALLRQTEYGNYSNDENQDVSNSFVWNKTEEGGDYWNEIENGNFTIIPGKGVGYDDQLIYD